MKYAAIAVLLVCPVTNAFADEPYPHEYENGGHFAAGVAAVNAPRTEPPFKHAYENGGHFEADLPESGTQKVAAK